MACPNHLKTSDRLGGLFVGFFPVSIFIITPQIQLFLLLAPAI